MVGQQVVVRTALVRATISTGGVPDSGLVSLNVIAVAVSRLHQSDIPPCLRRRIRLLEISLAAEVALL